MKKIFISLFIITTIFSFFSQTHTTEALVQTMDIGTPIASQNFNGLWNWKFKIKTTSVPDNTKITVKLQHLMEILSTKEVTVVNNSAEYDTGLILTSGVPYFTDFTLNVNPVIKKSYTGTPGDTINKPIVTSFSPTEGKVGDIVTIAGNNFTGVSNIFFGIINADLSSATISNTEIKVPVPANTVNGKITIKNSAGEGISPYVFKIADSPQGFEGQDDSSGNDGVYKLLAPIGEFTVAPTNIGEYFNTIFNIAIGLCAVLAVIMIVIGGVQYMGDESIFGKTEAKSKIIKSILGLLIALGAWALLNTINPDLLGGNVHIDQVSADIEEEDVPLTSNDPFTSGQKTEKCTAGIVNANTVNGNIPTCATLKAKIEKLVSDANKAGYKISGFGYRSKEKQEKLRAQNCGGKANVYNKNAKCKPLTAYPGLSRHENGLAIDFTCDGATIKSRDNKCFLWLKNNAGKSEYGGLKNLQKEPWHWSTDGK